MGSRWSSAYPSAAIGRQAAGEGRLTALDRPAAAIGPALARGAWRFALGT